MYWFDFRVNIPDPRIPNPTDNMTVSQPIIVFGPTSGVGSSVALHCHEEGLKVILAMRDITKAIPKLDGISAKRVHANLADPDSIKSAVQQTGAKRAFIYVIHGVKDGMLSALQALKESGIESVVLLSSIGVEGNARDVPPTKIIPYFHAQTEVYLDDIYEQNGTAVRAAHFASNVLFSKEEVIAGEVKLPNPDSICDWIAPENIGHVCALILAHGSRERVVSLFGPEQLSCRDAFALVGKSIQKDIKVLASTKDEAVENSQKAGLPKIVAEAFYEELNGPRGDVRTTPGYSENVGNVQKWIGKSPIRFEQWLEANKWKFEA